MSALEEGGLWLRWETNVGHHTAPATPPLWLCFSPHQILPSDSIWLSLDSYHLGTLGALTEASLCLRTQPYLTRTSLSPEVGGVRLH